MPIADYATYKSKVLAPYQRIRFTKTGTPTQINSNLLHSFWLSPPDAGVAPSTAEVPTRETLGALGQQNSDGIQRLAQIELSAQESGYLMVCDRLSHQGGLDGTVTEPQETNLPTAPLTRYTSGVGVFMALEIYTAIGTSGVLATASYTNQAGVNGRTSPGAIIGITYTVARLYPLPLAEEDTGVRSVESVTLAASTGAAGNFGVTLFKPLFAMPVWKMGSQQFLFDSVLNMCGNMPQIINDACLWYVCVVPAAWTRVWPSEIRLIEE